MLGTEEDINRRKSLLLDAFKTMENILLRSKKISEKIRIRVFKTQNCTTQNYGHLQAHLISKLIVSRENRAEESFRYFLAQDNQNQRSIRTYKSRTLG